MHVRNDPNSMRTEISGVDISVVLVAICSSYRFIGHFCFRLLTIVSAVLVNSIIIDYEVSFIQAPEQLLIVCMATANLVSTFNDNGATPLSKNQGVVVSYEIKKPHFLLSFLISIGASIRMVIFDSINSLLIILPVTIVTFDVLVDMDVKGNDTIMIVSFRMDVLYYNDVYDVCILPYCLCFKHVKKIQSSVEMVYVQVLEVESIGDLPIKILKGTTVPVYDFGGKVAILPISMRFYSRAPYSVTAVVLINEDNSILVFYEVSFVAIIIPKRDFIVYLPAVSSWFHRSSHVVNCTEEITSILLKIQISLLGH